MNLNYLAHARAIALGLHQTFEERPADLPGPRGARRLGASARTANELVYLVAHLLLAAGAMGIARFVWPAASARRRAALCATLALVPLLATHTGRDNLGVTLAAGLGASALALAASAATAARIGPATIAALLLAALSAALGTAGRYRGARDLRGWRTGARAPGWPDAERPRPSPRRRGARGGHARPAIAAVATVQRAVGGGPSHDPTYGFYTFFDGLPALMLGPPRRKRVRALPRVGRFFRRVRGQPRQPRPRAPAPPGLRAAALPHQASGSAAGLALALRPDAGGPGGGRGWPGRDSRPRQAIGWPRSWLLGTYLLPLGGCWSSRN